MLQSPKFHVSKTRLIIYNLPKNMTPKDVKKLCIDAVISRASKQRPVINKVPLVLFSSFNFHFFNFVCV